MLNPSSLVDLPAALPELAARVPAWRGLQLKVSALSGGITNRNFKVEAGGQAYVLRLGGANTQLLGIDRRTEHAAALAAATINAGPAVLHFVEPEGCLVTHFIPGRPITPAEMRQPDTIQQIAGLLRQVHQLPPIPGVFSPFEVIRDYRRLAAARGVSTYPTDVVDRLFDRALQIEQALAPLPPCPCHNDLLNENFLRETATGALRLLDWEYAGMGDPYFDLGNLAAQHDFGQAQDQNLLESYFGHAATPRLARLNLMKVMSDFREAMWGTLQSAISALDFDFRAYAARYFARVSTGLAEPRLADWLAEVSRKPAPA
jgi:thiamine kinase-like enzyme